MKEWKPGRTEYGWADVEKIIWYKNMYRLKF